MLMISMVYNWLAKEGCVLWHDKEILWHVSGKALKSLDKMFLKLAKWVQSVILDKCLILLNKIKSARSAPWSPLQGGGGTTRVPGLTGADRIWIGGALS